MQQMRTVSEIVGRITSGCGLIAQAEAARLRILHAQKVADRKAARDAELAERCVVQNFQFGTPAAVAAR